MNGTLIRSVRRTTWMATNTAIVVGSLACSDAPVVGAPKIGERTATYLVTQGCGASYNMISTETDSLMTQYGIPNTVDTVGICETWLGNDYAYQATAVGSSDNTPGFIDDVQTTTYENGNVVGYSQGGASAAAPSPVGATAFDMLYADDATRQASYDYPYYGVASPDPSTCLTPPCALQSAAPRTGISTSPESITRERSTRRTSSAATSGGSAEPFTKHGLIRRGVRALVDDASEIAPLRNGWRRFQAMHNNEVVIRSVDPKTQLLMAEEYDGAVDTMTASHSWSRVDGGYVRAYSDYVTVERVAGKRLHSHAHIVFRNVQIADRAYPTLVSSPPAP